MSLKVDYNSQNNQVIYVTAAEEIQNASTGLTYTFTFTHEQSDKQYSAVLTDHSDFPIRYNKFIFKTITGSTSSTNIGFEYGGWYKYEIYTTLSEFNYKLCEIGKCYVDDGTEQIDTYTTTQTKYVYKND